MRKLYLSVLAIITHTLAATSQPAISYQPFITGLSAPIEIVNAGDNTNRLFVVQQNGIIRVYDPANGGLQATNFLDISSLVTFSGEQGLLSMAFHPDYEVNGYFFVYYNNTSGQITLARYRISANPNVADAASGVVLMTISKPFTNHNGGHLQFGSDGNLYFATGDGGSGNDPNNYAQTGTSLLGKMIRINVNSFTTPPYYTVPATNPFVGNAAYDSRVWALGLRNPFRWSFDRATGDMWIGDVGQAAKEEVNYRPGSSTGGENYGWRCYEGTIPTPGVPACSPPGHILPIFEYDNPNGGAAPPSAVTGGYVYRGTEYPFFQGYYIATDVYSGTVYLIKSNGGGGWNFYQQTGLQNYVVSFGEAENGTLYAASQGTNTVYKVVASIVLPIRLKDFSGKRFNSFNELRWVTESEQNTRRFVVQYSNDGMNFQPAGEIPARNSATGGNYNFQHNAVDGNLYYRLAMESTDGSILYSNTIKISGSSSPMRIYPTIVVNNRLTLELPDIADEIQLYSSDGALVWKKMLNVKGTVAVELPTLSKGIYLARVRSGSKLATTKILIE